MNEHRSFPSAGHEFNENGTFRVVFLGTSIVFHDKRYLVVRDSNKTWLGS